MKRQSVQSKAIVKKKTTSKVLMAGEAAPYRIMNAKGHTAGLIICDHASKKIPRGLKGLGIKASEVSRHIGWDIGAAEVTRCLSRKLDMPAILAGYSRLVIDVNRAPDHDEAMPEVSDKTLIKGNIGLTKKARDQRLKEIFWPYQKEIGRQIDRMVKKKTPPLLLAIHSFTPEMGGVKRPWHISILWNKEAVLAKKVMKAIQKKHPQFLVGGNEPYTLKDHRFIGSTIWRHGEERNLPYVFVEFRQDLIDTKEKAAYWADVLIDALGVVLGKNDD